jgi:hypothetical protein
VPQRGNQRLLLDIVNRGTPTVLTNLNGAVGYQDPGNGFLMRQGYTVVWCGWQDDVPATPGLLRIQVPEVLDAAGQPITGKIAVTFQPDTPLQVHLLSDRLHRPHPAKDLHDPEVVLTAQDHEDAPPQTIPRQRWSFARLDGDRVVPDANHIYLASGFLPGKVYQVVYTTVGAPVIGLGLLAMRDIAAFVRYGSAGKGNPCAGHVQYAYAFGRSQSGRFLRHFLYLGLNQDERQRRVFDGLIPLVAGIGRGEFNQRFGQPSNSHKYSTKNLGFAFPFHDTVQTNPETGRTDGLLARLASTGALPKIFFIDTSAEYWGGYAALTHTGWNVRHPAIGGSGQILPLLGSTLPFPATRAERQAAGDPRPSIEERYTSKTDYLRQVQQAAEALVQQGYLLAEDLPTVADQAAQRYDLFRGR